MVFENIVGFSRDYSCLDWEKIHEELCSGLDTCTETTHIFDFPSMPQYLVNIENCEVEVRCKCGKVAVHAN